jgi:hypothetical protein
LNLIANTQKSAGDVFASPFVVLIDSMEQHPFSFRGVRADISDMNAAQRKLFESGQWDGFVQVQTKYKALGASNGDYSIEGFEGRCHLERKSMEDCHGTVLGWGDRRERFKRELANLAEMQSAAVVVECSFGDLLASAPEHGKKSAAENRKILFRQILSWQQRFRVPWMFCDSRGMAELFAYRWFERFFLSQQFLEKEIKCL